MRIKKLEILGFKSFKDKTVVHFDSGITGVVGPNGCGKSNIVDALMWVMGEMSAKHLRGSSMEDVIFAGADGFQPAGLAEVSLTLENDGGLFPARYSQFSEIMVTRQLLRSGESSYSINREPARLKDIQEIFMDTGAGAKGFSIIAQGMISQLITQKPEERRRLIEEAAGITKFKVRKKESLRKLESTEQNLVRLNDMVTELKRQLDSLKRQAEKAEKYKSLKEQLQSFEVTLAKHDLLKLKQDFAQSESELLQLGEEEGVSTARLSSLELDSQKFKVLLQQAETEIQDLQRQSSELSRSLQKKELELQEAQFLRDQAQRLGERAESQLDELRAREEVLSAELLQSDERLSALQSQFEVVEGDYQKKRSELDQRQLVATELESEVSRKQRACNELQSQQASGQTKMSMIADQLDEVLEQIEAERRSVLEVSEEFKEFERRKNKISGQLETEKQLRFEISNDLETHRKNLNLLEQKNSEKVSDIETLKEELGQVRQRLKVLKDLEDSFEGFQEGAREIVRWGNTEESKRYTPLSELIEVDKSAEAAVSAYLGPNLELLMSDSVGESLSAIAHLAESKKGIGRFSSPQILHGLTLETEAPRPSLDALSSKVKGRDERVQGALASWLQDVYLAESLTEAIEFAQQFPQFSFVTRGGEVVDSRGVIIGGSTESLVSSNVLIRKREIKELGERESELAGKLSLTIEVQKKIQKQIDQMRADEAQAERRQIDFDLRLAGLTKDFERAQSEFESARSSVMKRSEVLNRLESKEQSLRAQHEVLEEEIEDALVSLQELTLDLERLTSDLQAKRSQDEGLRQDVVQAQLAHVRLSEEISGLKKNRDLLSGSLSQVRSQISQSVSDKTQSSDQSLENSLRIERLKEDVQSLVRRLSDLETLQSDRSERFRGLQGELSLLTEELEVLKNKAHHQKSRELELKSKRDQLQFQMDHLQEQIREKYLVELETMAAANFDDNQELPSVSEVAALKTQIQKMGDVNLSAIREFEEIQERYSHLSTQQQDLQTAKEQLLKVIEKINEICTDRFSETFVQVNERFQKVFPVLFGGGEAELSLTPATEKEEEGIEISAKPPGKKMQSVNLLSGGEKALTAVSLIFAIFLVKPSPYCLLDEVDAPLDDANVSRFNNLVQEMAKRSQIILVTHNKHTMETAGRLYGVTMQDKGVSKLVSVSLEGAAKIVNESAV